MHAYTYIHTQKHLHICTYIYIHHIVLPLYTKTSPRMRSKRRLFEELENFKLKDGAVNIIGKPKGHGSCTYRDLSSCQDRTPIKSYVDP